MTHFLYLLINTDLHKVYVGVTIEPLSRLHSHMRGNSTNYLIKEDRDLYTFEFEIIASGSHDFIYSLESEMIEFLNTTHPHGYNLSSGGFGGCNKEDAARGENQGNSKLKNSDIIDIRNLYNSNKYTQEKLAEIYNVSRSNISTICSGKSWTHIEGPFTVKRSNISNELKEKIFNLSLTGMSSKDISEELNCTCGTAKKYRATREQVKEKTIKDIKDLQAKNISVSGIAATLNKGETTIRRYIKEI